MKPKAKYLLCILIAALMLTAMLSTAAFAEAEDAVSVATAEEFKNAVADASIISIKLTADIDLTDAGVLNVSGRTIDLNGNKIMADNFTLIFQGTDFTIKNGTLDANGGAYALFIGDEETTENVLIEDVTMLGGVNVYNAHSVTLKNVDITGTSYYAIWCDQNGQVKIESGAFQSSGVAVIGMSATESALNIENGTFATNGKPLVLKDGDKYGKPIISGGTFDILPDEEYYAEGFEPIEDENGQFIICNHSDTEVKNTKEATCTEKGYTGDTYCKTCGKLLKSGVETDAVGHTPSDWKSDKNNHWKECLTEDCGIMIPDSQASHTDADNDGKCDICGYQMKSEVEDPSQTDDSHSSFWIVLVLLATTASAAYIYKIKKCNN